MRMLMVFRTMALFTNTDVSQSIRKALGDNSFYSL